MKNIKLGNNFEIDLAKLIDSKMLIQANSGGGKSWAIRRILEQSHGKVQQIILDPEGEFSTLREKYDYILAGKDGDTPADPKSASLLARKLLELNVSCVIDLFELHPQDRKRFVRLFLESMVNAPKDLWHPCLVIIDEAHTFAPEKGESEALSAVIGLASLGRKRGFGAILATQRISKLHKDAAAECNNKMIGRTGLDIDRKRAAEEIGFTSKDDVISLRTLEPGQFYAFGPAISSEVIKRKVGEIQTSHPIPGKSFTQVAPPTDKIKKVLGKLADLPNEAKKEAQTIDEYKAEIRQLKTKLSHNPQKIVEIDLKAVEKAKKDTERRKNVEFMAERDEFLKHINTLFKVIETIGKTIKDIKMPDLKKRKIETEKWKEILKPQPKENYMDAKPYHPIEITGEPSGISGPEQRILNAIAWLESIGNDEPNQTAVAFLAGYTYGGGGFNNPRGSLRTKGLVEYVGERIKLTDNGKGFAHTPIESLTTEELHRKVLSILPSPEQKLLKPLLERYPEAVAGTELAEIAGYMFGSGGFNNPKGRLRSLGLIEYLSGGFVKAKSLLFLE